MADRQRKQWPGYARRERRRGARPILALLVVLLLPGAANTAEDSAVLYKLQAAYLYQFTKFISWPASSFSSPTSSFRICVAPRAGIRAFVEPLASRATGGHPIEIVDIEVTDSLHHCHVLLLDRRDQARPAAWLAKLGDAPLLTVSDLDGFAEQGGMIGFIVSENKLKVDINLANLQRSRLRISAKLLEVARRVHGGGAGP